VATGIKTHKQLKILNLGRTDLSTEGATLLINQLNRGFESLDISYNPRIEKKAYTELAHKILDNPLFNKLHTLKLEGNKIDDGIV